MDTFNKSKPVTMFSKLKITLCFLLIGTIMCLLFVDIERMVHVQGVIKAEPKRNEAKQSIGNVDDGTTTINLVLGARKRKDAKQSIEPDDGINSLSRYLKQYTAADDKSDFPFTSINLTEYAKKIWYTNTDCRWVVRMPRDLWRCQDLNGTRTAEKDYERMSHIVLCGGPLDPKYLKTPNKKQLYDFEKFYLSEKPLNDENLATDESKSTAQLMNKSSTFKVGDVVAVRIDMKNKNGRQKTSGGDVIRAWIRDDSRQRNSLTMHVQDLNNGTYLATSKLMWDGNALIKVALVYPREYLRALVHLMLTKKSLKLSVAAFKNSKADECTVCSHVPILPGYDGEKMCNLTHLNGSPWFCGQPIKSQLKCSDFHGSRNLPQPKSKHALLPVTDAELRVLERSNVKPLIRYIGKGFKIKIDKGGQSHETMMSRTPCHKIPPSETWNLQTPTGHFYQDVWYPKICASAPITKQCYENLRVVILGDSNSRSHHHAVCSETKSQHIQKALYKSWHKPLSCENKQMNFSSLWYPHQNPFMSTDDKWAQFGNLMPSPQAIDAIPSTGRTLLILHHYIHITIAHMSVMEAIHRANKDAVVRLIKRNPEAMVIIRGVHTAYGGWDTHYALGDMFGKQIAELVKDIYKDIRDKVVYFSPWDMTVATEQLGFHPSIHSQIHKTLMSFMCGR